jgi:hypothetical protein
MKTFHVVEPVFKTDPLFILNCTYAEMVSYLKKNHGVEIKDDGNPCIGTMLTFSKKPWRVVWVREFSKKNPENWGSLAHEIFHLVTRVMEDKGVTLRSHFDTGECGDEAAAYLYEHYFKSAYQQLLKK